MFKAKEKKVCDRQRDVQAGRECSSSSQLSEHWSGALSNRATPVVHTFFELTNPGRFDLRKSLIVQYREN